MRRFSAVLLDVDGTLVDSNDAHAHAWVDAFAERGIDVAVERVRRMIGMGGDRVIAEIAPREKHLADRRAELFRERWLARVTPLPKARELVLRLQAEGYEIAIASAARPDELAPLLEVAGIADLVPKNAPEVRASKPDPETIEAALARVDAPRERAVMVGDTPYDVQAARAAGVAVIGVTTGGWSVEGLAGALAVYDGPAGLLAKWEHSPLAATFAHACAR
jgi:HAD superfamily hydrolase (TIGR01509 family)